MGKEGKNERRAIEKADEERYGITSDEKEDFIDERTEYRNAFDKALEEQTVTDALTGLKNRKFLVNELENSLPFIRGEIEEHRRRGVEQLKEAALLFIDLDNFKKVNDTFGHTEGDTVLKKVAEILTGSVRKSDIVARFGGDEFYIFLSSANKDKAIEIANEICENLRNDPKLHERTVTASIGVRPIDASNVADSETLIKQADVAVYKAKEGKNQVLVYEEGMKMLDSDV
ncbi:hypothetical protein A2118_03090 [Candidatus Kaiserbacteria bacterium GWA2_50_9]|uniref:GGDEF domain-containing protein n=1 Tax=Candidatus Kaiserbacteria bacterium GWA2_50_9 TaxID=1798474 RepID=A0A1F6BWR8_9BACT|nr:MAG: hypothetical protein A2118_03090 [Candidatus Kaiserbacteria bacterium GWA2_50_9]